MLANQEKKNIEKGPIGNKSIKRGKRPGNKLQLASIFIWLVIRGWREDLKTYYVEEKKKRKKRKKERKRERNQNPGVPLHLPEVCSSFPGSLIPVCWIHPKWRHFSHSCSLHVWELLASLHQSLPPSTFGESSNKLEKGHTSTITFITGQPLNQQVTQH